MNTNNAQKIADMVQVDVEYRFTEQEILQKSQLIANTLKDKEDLEAKKKQSSADYKNKIDTLSVEIKTLSTHITSGYEMRPVASEIWLDFDKKERVHIDKHSGEEIKREVFRASDYQQQIDFDEQETNRQEQIDENNEAGNFAEQGLFPDRYGNLTDIPVQSTPDIIGELIEAKKAPKSKKAKPTPKDNLHPNYGKGFESEE